MNPQDPLAQLRDIHMPDPGGFWPPAPGWWLLAVILLALMAAAAWLLRRKRRKSRWLRLAQAELALLEKHPEQAPSWFSQLNILLKQAARERYPELHPEALSGDAWVAFLLSTSPKDRIASRPVVEAVVHGAWQPQTDADPHQALTFARRWLGGQAC